MSEQGILIAGGYGVVGQRIAAALAPDYPVIVAGRHLEQAKAASAAIGHGVRSRLIDVTVEASIAAALEGVATVVSCIDQPRRSLLHAAIERGLRYTDITPHLVELGSGAAYEEIGAAARTSGARVVLGTGIVPGISNVIVRAVADTLGGADVIETSLLLSASDASGPASFDYFVKELTMPVAVDVDGVGRAQDVDDPGPAHRGGDDLGAEGDVVEQVGELAGGLGNLPLAVHDEPLDGDHRGVGQRHVSSSGPKGIHPRRPAAAQDHGALLDCHPDRALAIGAPDFAAGIREPRQCAR